MTIRFLSLKDFSLRFPNKLGFPKKIKNKRILLIGCMYDCSLFFPFLIGFSLVDPLKSAFFPNSFHFWLIFFRIFHTKSIILIAYFYKRGCCSPQNRKLKGPKLILLLISRRRQPALIHFDCNGHTVNWSPFWIFATQNSLVTDKRKNKT